MSEERKAMMLPDGKTCNDCIHFERCQMLFKCNPKNTDCDWYPSKFLEIKRN